MSDQNTNGPLLALVATVQQAVAAQDQVERQQKLVSEATQRLGEAEAELRGLVERAADQVAALPGLSRNDVSRELARLRGDPAARVGTVPANGVGD